MQFSHSVTYDNFFSFVCLGIGFGVMDLGSGKSYFISKKISISCKDFLWL